MGLAILGGIVIVVLLRAMANTGAATGNINNQTVTKVAQTYVPFAHAGSISTPGASNNPRNTNGNGQQIVTAAPDASVINQGSQDAVLSTNFDSSNAASLACQPTFAWDDLASGATTQQPTYWRLSNQTTDANTGYSMYTWQAPINYSGPPQMVNCPTPTNVLNEDVNLPYLPAGNAISW
jgi:hypothetical protein